jgi:anti-anti-sigma factor
MKLKIVRQKTDSGSLHLTLTGEMTIYSSAKLKNVLMKELESSSGITMNLSGIDEADTSGFQLLLFLKREAETLGKSFRITETSRRLKAIFTLYKEMI